MRRVRDYTSKKYLADVASHIATANTPFYSAVSPNGQLLAVVQDAPVNSVSLIDTGTNVVVATYPTGDTPISPRFTPDGTILLVANAVGNSVTRIVLATGAVSTIPVGVGPQCVSITPDGLLAFTSNEPANSYSRIVVATSAVTNILSGVANIEDCVFTKDSSLMFSPIHSPATAIRRMVVATNALSSVALADTTFGSSLALTPEGDAIWCATKTGFQKYHIGTGIVDAPIAYPNATNGCHITVNGKYVLTRDFPGNFIRKLNTVTGIVTSIAVNGPNSVAFTPDSLLAYSVDTNSNTVVRIDLETDAVSRFVTGNTPVWIQCLPNGLGLYCSNYADNNVSVINPFAAVA